MLGIYQIEKCTRYSCSVLGVTSLHIRFKKENSSFIFYSFYYFLNMKLYIHSNFELIKGFHAQQILSRRSNLHILRYSAYCTLVRNFIYWKFTHFVFIRSKLQEYLRKRQTNLSGILLPHTLLRIFHINTQ